MRFTLLLALALWAGPTFAAYRVYKLTLTHHDQNGRPQKKETVTSTLDPYQYEHYHSGYRWMRVDLLDSWYCPGDTSYKKSCAKPRDRMRLPASMEREKRLPLNRQPVIP